ncbi:hypothetical protein MMC11_005238 [Xylographa trunciseda]|nr:hypothetical protein [Xylographa trunciseda]
MPSTRSSKKQTRLAFTPLPSSSPQTASLPSHLQTRAASVRYDELVSPTKRRRLLNAASSPEPTNHNRPETPSRSSGQDSDVAHDSKGAPIMQSPFKRPWSSTKTSSLKRINRGLPTPNPSSQLQPGEADSDGETISSDTDSNIILPKARLAQPSTPRSKLRNVSNTQSRSRTNSIVEDDEDVLLPKRGRRSVDVKEVVLSSDDDTDEEAVTLSSPHQQRHRLRGAGTWSPTADQSRHFFSSRINPRSLFLGGHSGSAHRMSSHKHLDLTPTKPKNRGNILRSSRASMDKDQTKRRRPTRINAPMHRPEELSDYDSSLPDVGTLLTPRASNKKVTNIMSDDGSDIVVAPHRSGRVNESPRKTLSFDHGSEESEDVVATPSKRRLLVRHIEQYGGRDAPRKQDAEDLEEDLEVLQDTELRTERTRGKPAPSKRNAALQMLKARRDGQKSIDLSSESEAAMAPRRALYDHDSVSEMDTQEDEEWTNEAIRQSLRDEEGEYDEDFVVDDEEETLGAPNVLEDIPLEFTRHAHKKTKEHFKDVVEWMVHKKLNPAFPRDDAVYRVAFHKLDDEVAGYAGSKFVSAAWIGDFARAIKARPRYSDVPVPVEMFNDHRHCDACNRSNHPARFIITFSGKAYNKETLENVSEDDEDEENDSNDDDAESHDVDGNILPSVKQEYYLGRFCKANAEIAHSLLHWRYHLNDWILDWLQNEGYETPEKIIERDKWSIKKRSDYANKVVDEMEKKGEVRALYRDFKTNLDTARNYKPDYKSRRS